MLRRSSFDHRFKFFFIGFLALCCVAVASTAKADAIGTLPLSDCGGDSGCPAATYAFDISSSSATLTITITGAPDSTNDFIGSVDLGFTASSNIGGLTLTAAPSPLADWTSSIGSVNSNGNGCGGNTGAFVCATALPSNPLPITQGGVYTWTWSYNALSSSQVAADGSVHIGTQYGPNANNNWKGLIVSETVSLPEPSTLVFLGVGLFALAGLAKKSSRA